MRVYLKVKIKSLAAEAVIIRQEERKHRKPFICEHAEAKFAGCEPVFQPRPIFFGLRHHRIVAVRRAARHAQLAYGFIRGTSYFLIERKRHDPPNWGEVEKLALRYGASRDRHGVIPKADQETIKADLKRWIADGEALQKHLAETSLSGIPLKGSDHGQESSQAAA